MPCLGFLNKVWIKSWNAQFGVGSTELVSSMGRMAPSRHVAGSPFNIDVTYHQPSLGEVSILLFVKNEIKDSDSQSIFQTNRFA